MSKIILSKYFINNITNIILLYIPLCKICDEFAIYLNIFGNFCNIHKLTCTVKTQKGNWVVDMCGREGFQCIYTVFTHYVCENHKIVCDMCNTDVSGCYFETMLYSDYYICKKCKSNFYI
jgi:hypothetical protein